MRIGLVLAGVPEYSETFFKSKVSLLQQTNDTEVIVFSDRYSPNDDWTLCKVVYGIQVQGRRLPGLLVTACFLRTLFLHPVRTLKLLLLNHKTRMSRRANIRSIIRSSHLLGQSLDWLHFGFGTMAVGRENIARIIGAKMAVSFRGFDHYIFPLKNPGCYRELFERTDKFHVLSQHMKSDLIGQGVPAPAIHVITPAINVLDFSLPERKTGMASTVRMLTVARLHWIKGLEYTLEALNLLKGMGVDFHYTIVGDGPERERLVFARHQLGLTQHVTFTGKLTHGEVAAALRQADLYIQYSIQEGFCNAVLEAQALGLFCIVSDADGLSENVVHDKTGWIVPKRRPLALAAKIREILSMEEPQLSAIRENAMARTRRFFDLKNQKEAFVKFYAKA